MVLFGFSILPSLENLSILDLALSGVKGLKKLPDGVIEVFHCNWLSPNSHHLFD